MSFTKLKDRFVFFTEHLNGCWHKTTNDNEFLPTLMPWKVMNWPIFSFNWWYFVFSIIINKQTKLAIIRFAWWIKICLKLHQKAVRNRTESNLNLFSFLYFLVIKGLFIRFLGKYQAFSWICLPIQINSNQKILFSFTDLWNFEKFQ